MLPRELVVVSAGDPRCCELKQEPTLLEFSVTSSGGGYDMLKRYVTFGRQQTTGCLMAERNQSDGTSNKHLVNSQTNSLWILSTVDLKDITST